MRRNLRSEGCGGSRLFASYVLRPEPLSVTVESWMVEGGTQTRLFEPDKVWREEKRCGGPADVAHSLQRHTCVRVVPDQASKRGISQVFPSFRGAHFRSRHRRKNIAASLVQHHHTSLLSGSSYSAFTELFEPVSHPALNPMRHPSTLGSARARLCRCAEPPAFLG